MRCLLLFLSIFLAVCCRLALASNKYEALDPQLPRRRSGTVDIVEVDGEEVALCHILGLLAASHPDRDGDGDRCDPVHLQIKYNEMAAILLAIDHFNHRDTSVVPELASLTECPIRFTSELHDDHHNPSHAVKILTRIFAERDPESRDSSNGTASPQLPMPCAVHGAGWSSVSKPSAVVTGSYGLPQMSYLSTSPELSQRWNYPTFSRAVPTDAAAASAAVRFLGEHCQARHVAVLFINDSYGNEFHRAFREFALEAYDMNVVSVPLPIEPTKENIDDAMAAIADSGFRYVFAIIFEQHYDSVMTAAVQNGVAGTGKHFWLIGNDGIRHMLEEIEYEKGSDLAVATEGIGVLPEFGGEPVAEGYQKFLSAWKRQGPEDVEYFNSKVPVIDNLPGSDCYSPESPSDYFQTEIPPSTSAFAYDTVMALGLGACRAYNKENLGLDGREHDAEILRRTKFEGATGLVHIDEDIASRNPLTFTYVVLNVVAASNKESSSTFTRFETPETILLTPNDEGTDWEVMVKAPFVFPDGSTTPPEDLSPVEENKNYVGGLRIFGYVLFSVVAALSVCFAIWTWANREKRVVRASQPIFLGIILIGVLILGSAIIPLSIDDEHHSPWACNISCMLTPWLGSLGFVTAFSGLFSKTWRINLLMKSASKFKRVKITETDVIKPFAVLMTANVVVLAVWTAVAPLRFERMEDFSDEFERVLSSHGSCVASTENRAIPFIACLAAINLCPLIFANVQAYKARNIHTEYSESRYIAMVNGSLLQAWFTGIPLLVMVRDNPSAFFVVAAMILFLTSLAIMLLIFVPKIDFLRIQNRETKTSGRQSNAENGLKAKVFRGSAGGKAFAANLSSYCDYRDSLRKSSDGGLPTKCFANVSSGNSEHNVSGLQLAVSEEENVSEIPQKLEDHNEEEHEETQVANDGLLLNVETSPVGRNGAIEMRN